MLQWQFGYKDGQKPVQTAILEASSEEKAQEVALAWCSKNIKQENPGSIFRLCWVRPVVVADESILEAAQPAKAPAAPLPTVVRQ